MVQLTDFIGTWKAENGAPFTSHTFTWALRDGHAQRHGQVRGGPRNSDRLLRWDPDQGEGVWNATEETELSC